MYERAVVGALGASGVTYAAYKLLFPWIGQDIHDIRLLSPLKTRWAKYVENQKRLVDAFEEKGLQTPDKYFIIYNDTVYTYGQMLEAANRVSHVARTWRLEQGEAAALFMENEPAYIAVFFGLQMVGIPVALLNHNIRGESLERCIESVDTKIVISGEDEHLVEALLEIQPNLPGTQLFVHGRSGTELPPCMNSLTDLLKVSPTSSLGKEARAHSPYDGASFYIYTSGTTGLPKAAKSTHARACGALNLLPAIAQITADDIVYTTVPLFHSSGFIVGLAGIIAEGATVVLRKKFSASHFWEDCCRHRVTVVQYIGELIRYLLAQPVTAREKQHCVRVAVGNGLREDIWEEFQRRCRIPSIVEFFAASEGGSILVNLHNVPGACGRYSPFMQRMDPYPKYLIEHEPGTDQPRRNKNGRCVKVRNGQPGLLIAAFSPMSKPEDIYKADMSVIEKKLLRNVFKDGDVFFNYGDLLYLDKNYFFRFADRTGDTFRWKGENVSTQEVSNILSRVDFLLDANVYGVSIPGQDGKAGMACLVLHSGETSLSDDMCKKLYKHCKKTLPSYARPLFLRVQREMELTGTYKQRKVDLVKEGFDPSQIQDPLYFLDRSRESYVPLTASLYSSLVVGKAKL